MLQKNGVDEKPVAPGGSIGQEARKNWSSLQFVKLADFECDGRSSGICANYVSLEFSNLDQVLITKSAAATDIEGQLSALPQCSAIRTSYVYCLEKKKVIGVTLGRCN